MTNCFCGEETGHLNNHVRMSSGGDHGPQGEYPEGWDVENPEANVQDEEDRGAASHPADEPTGEEARAASGSPSDEDEPDVEDGIRLDPESDPGEGDPDAQLEQLLFGDTDADASEYECGNCETPLEYLGGDDAEDGGKECGECGERLFWSMMDA